MTPPELLAQLEELLTDFSFKNIKVVNQLVEEYLSDYSKSDTDQYLSEESIAAIQENAKQLSELPNQFNITTEKVAMRKQYGKHISQMCKFIRVSYKAYSKLSIDETI